MYGRIIYKNDEEVAIASNPFNFGEIRRIPAGKVDKIKLSQISMMPPGTVGGMNKHELMDLMAYLVSGGDRNHRAFKAK